MILETKAFDAGQSFAQRDTFDVVDKILKSASVKNNRRRAIKIADSRRGPGSVRFVRWLGYHILQMSDATPDKSKTMRWDSKYFVSMDDLIKLLKFELDPDHPTKKLDIRRHHVIPQCELPLPLLQLVRKVNG